MVKGTHEQMFPDCAACSLRAQRGLVIPMTQAQSGYTLPRAGHIGTKAHRSCHRATSNFLWHLKSVGEDMNEWKRWRVTMVPSRKAVSFDIGTECR